MDCGHEGRAGVLIVEDSRAQSLILGDIVERAGHEVFFASDGEQALELCVGESINVVITDLQMPHCDGLVLITALREAFPETAIIAMSAIGSDLLAEAKSQGAFAALSKPIELVEFIEALAQAAQDSSVGPPKSCQASEES